MLSLAAASRGHVTQLSEFCWRAETLASMRAAQREISTRFTQMTVLLLLSASLPMTLADSVLIPTPAQAPSAVNGTAVAACWIPSESFPVLKCERVLNTCPGNLTLAEAELCMVCERGATPSPNDLSSSASRSVQHRVDELMARATSSSAVRRACTAQFGSERHACIQ